VCVYYQRGHARDTAHQLCPGRAWHHDAVPGQPVSVRHGRSRPTSVRCVSVHKDGTPVSRHPFNASYATSGSRGTCSSEPRYITLDREPLVLLSPQTIFRGEQCAEARLGRQSDRAAGWSCGRQSRAGRRPTAEPSWLPSAAGAVHRNTVGWPRARRWAWWPRRCGGRPCLRQRVGVLGQRPESTVWCGCPASSVPVHAAAVPCPVRASERPDVRCPAWCPVSVGSRVHCVRPGGCGGVAVGRQPHGWDGRRRRGRLPCPRPVVGCPGRNLAVEAGAGLRGQRRVGLDLAVVVGGGWAVARSTAWATRIGWMDAGIAR
jgi:hypothetical protein